MEITTSYEQVRDPEAIGDVIRAILGAECEVDRDKEHLWVIGVDTRKVIKYIELVSLGTLTETVIHPREVFRFAILKGVDAIILAHNHPSGCINPSEQDRMVTHRLVECGRLLGISVVDHVIVTADGYYSFFKQGVLL
ncbi:MAG: JAB domain-containing protein [Patescibacteria group bacterium]|nr:JAB domain-containing protein [Patescibacteria group bacterium]